MAEQQNGFPTKAGRGSQGKVQNLKRNKDPLDIRNFYREVIGIEDEDTLDFFEQNTRYTTYYKGDIFIHAGEPASTLRFILSGVSSGYYLDENGLDHTICLSYRFGEPLLGAPTLSSLTQIYMDALTDLEVLELPVSAVMESFSKNLQNVSIYEQLLANDRYKEYDQHIALSTLEGRDRYLWFCDRYREIIDIVPQSLIASFLGIRPQSLSRIKRQLREERKQNND